MSRIRKLGQTDIEISAIGYGCMGQTHSYGVVETEEDMVSLMQHAYETGYTFYKGIVVYGYCHYGTRLRNIMENFFSYKKYQKRRDE